MHYAMRHSPLAEHALFADSFDTECEFNKYLIPKGLFCMNAITISSLFSWLVVSLFCLPFFIIAKVLTLDWKPRLKESAFIFFASLITAGIILLNRALHDVFSHVLGDYTLMLLLTLYLYKVNSYPLKKAIPLMLLSIMIVIIAELTLSIFLYFFSQRNIPFFSTNFTSAFPTRVTLSQFLRFALPLYILVALFTAAFLRFSKKARKTIARNPYLQSRIMLFCIYCIVFLTVIANTWRAMALSANPPAPNLPLGFIFLCIMFVLFNLHTIAIYSEHEKRQRDIDQQNLQYYIDDLERQQADILKFKHDHQNLLLSMQSFLHDEDLEGLKQLFASTSEVASSAIKESYSIFGSLHRIKLREIKSILAAKLILAKSMNANIHAIFEANEDIYEFPIDSVTLVRMLGIILDNAIEALSELSSGTLLVSCIKWESGITFIVENTCRSDIPTLGQLWSAGFSTKGAERGQGLSILSELINSCSNVSLETSIEGSSFRQALLIEFEEGE